jgi:D-serine deaminase-like pyridoxal phosphate-dependent protein
MMSYEAQVAGIGDRPAGRPVRGVAARWLQRQSTGELAARRQAAVAAVRQVAPLEFVNGGGTGSIESTRDDASVTDIAAGSGLFGGHLFDDYDSFRPAPAAAFALPVVRKPSPGLATLLGGGWVASGPPGADRLPRIVWPQGLAMTRREMAGEVQSPVTGRAAAELRLGDRVWLRHAKSGELSEHVSSFALVDGGEVVDVVPTYRGEGRAFL